MTVQVVSPVTAEGAAAVEYTAVTGPQQYVPVRVCIHENPKNTGPGSFVVPSRVLYDDTQELYV